MEQLDDLEQVQGRCLKARAEHRIGFVPTMGYLHQGHLSLIRQARADCEMVVVSIFVNPLQFEPSEDLACYPRDLKRDSRLCREAGADLLFTTSPEQMYPSGYSTFVVEETLGRRLCGATRPRHFRGVTTVVTKLFNLVTPHVAYFGRKDAQQAAILERMTSDLNFPIQIRVMPIVREADGLALSSRNAYLTPPQRLLALNLIAALKAAGRLFAEGERNSGALVQRIRTVLAPDGETVRIDYVEIVSRADFQPVDTVCAGDLVALAVFVGKTRLIDNMIFGETP